MRGRNAIGVIQHRPTIENPMDGTGGEWEEFATCYPNVMPLRGQELFQAQQVQSQVTHKIETEWIDGVTSAMRLRVPKPTFSNSLEPEADENYRFFQITQAINVNEANRSLELLCIEKV